MFYTNATTNQYSSLECQPITPIVLEKPIKWKSNHIEVAPNCPRCASSKTKFCYYNNYSLSQPRYFCKGCKRYWTKGGSLRNVPVGGSCRKRGRVRSVVRQGDGTNCPNPALHVGPTNESENGTDIDLAVIFAKYVNPNHEIENSSGSIANFENVEASSLDTDGVSATFEYEKSIDFINGDEDQLQELLPQLFIHEEVNDQDLFNQNSVSFELQGVLDELDRELEGTNLPNFGCQPSMEQFQDFGLLSDHDQLRFPANSVSDSWDSFDLSAYEAFSRP